MRILALDTSSDRLAVALWSPSKTVESLRRLPKGHDERLIPEIDRLLKKAGWKLKDVDVLAVTRGPGRFTGVRIGLTFAAVLSRFSGKPAVGVSVLEALAWQALGSGLVAPGEAVCPVLTAIRDEVYWQVFERGRNGRLKALTPPTWSKAEELAKGTERPVALLGSGGPTAAAVLGKNGRLLPEKLWALRASSVAKLAATLLGKKPRSSGLSPLYLKSTSYEKKR